MSEKLLFRTLECQNQRCRFRFPVMDGKPAPENCPNCAARVDTKADVPYERHRLGRSPLNAPSLQMHILLDNIRSLYNVGSIFRTAEAVGAAKLHLCGMTATPKNPRLAKTALGAEEMVAWEYHNNALLAAQKLRDEGFALWALEGGDGAESIFGVSPPKPKSKLVLVVGNEMAGVDPEVLTLCKRVLYIPMNGKKESLNLAVAFGIAAYRLLPLS